MNTLSEHRDARCIAARVGRSLYGFPVGEVQEVISLRPLSRLFHAPPALPFVTSLRGEVLPVIDLSVLLGERDEDELRLVRSNTVASTAAESSVRVVVVREAGGARRRAGLLVSELSGLREYPNGTLHAAPSTVPEALRELLSGVIEEPPACAVLSVSALLDAPGLAFD